MRTQLFPFIFLTMIFASQTGCKKTWLDAKPNSQLVVASSLSNFQGMEDNPLIYQSNSLGETGADNYIIAPSSYAYLTASDFAEYLWAPTGYGVSSQNDWAVLYEGIFNDNAVIDGLANLTVTADNQALYNQVLGTSLYYRAFGYYELSQTFCKSYDSSSATSDPGLPLRLHANVAASAGRGTVQKLYDQIFSDLQSASKLLPDADQAYKTRPSKVAAFALLTRAYLSIRNYSMAKVYADSTLAIKNTLLDFNTLTPSTNLSMPTFNLNPEVVSYTVMADDDINIYVAMVDSALFSSYDSNDLRKTLFFTDAMNFIGVAGWVFNGSYDGDYNGSLFSAPALDEIYLTRAECEARTDDLVSAKSDLNLLMGYRYKTGTYMPYSSTNADSVLARILIERRKELVMRGVRWTDLRRLNKDPRFATTISHIYNGTAYYLQPNSNEYIYPLPDDEVTISGIAQNPR